MKAKVFTMGNKKSYSANFTIGVQTFTICKEVSKKEALWYCKMLRIALKSLKQ